MPTSDDVKGSAALSICESLLLCLTDLNVLRQEHVVGILSDVAAAYRDAAGEGLEVEHNLAAAELITTIMNSGNSVRHR